MSSKKHKDSIYRPIFIFGISRSGTTLFYSMLANHRDLAFISNFNVKFPKSPFIWRINSLFGKVGLRAGLVKPDEAYPLFNSIFPGYANPIRNLGSCDIFKSVYEGVRNLVNRNLIVQGKRRFVYKYTGWPRIGFFNAIFPDALFIHIIRDGRAVANSKLSATWWNGWRGPQNWRWGELPEGYREEWERGHRSFALLAGIEWKILLDEVERSKKVISEKKMLLLRYEDFVENPLDAFEKVCNFCDLPNSAKFKKRLQRYSLRNTNYKWREQLSESDQILLTKCLQGHLRRYGYEVNRSPANEV